MSSCDFLISFDTIKHLSLLMLRQYLRDAPSRVIGEMTIRELSDTQSNPHGVYLFFENNADKKDLVYVGKSTSRSFIERLPAHFDSRVDAWMNTLIKKVSNYHNCSRSQALEMALGYRIVLIGVTNKTVGIRLESVLRSFMRPRYNPSNNQYEENEELEVLVSV